MNQNKNLIFGNETYTLDDLTKVKIALENAMNKLEKEKVVKTDVGNPNKVTVKKNGKTKEIYRIDCFDCNGKRIQITSVEYDVLIEKAYAQLMAGTIRSKKSVSMMAASTIKRLKPTATVKEVFEKYHEERLKDVELEVISSQTADYDLSTWKRFWSDCPFVNLPIKDITTQLLETEFCRKCGNGTKYTEKAFMKAKSLLNKVFGQAIIDGIISNNASKITPTKRCRFIITITPSNTQTYYSQNDVQKIRDYIKSLAQKDTYALGVLLATHIFCRVGELRALTWDDYNPATGELTISHQIVKVKQNGKQRVDVDVPYTKSRKEQGTRTLELSPEVMDILEELRKINGDKKYILQGSRDAKFSVSENRFNEHIKTYCEACGVTYHSSHKFRFYGITRCYELGVDEEDIQYNAGHTTAAMTRKYNKPTQSRKGVSSAIMAQI